MYALREAVGGMLRTPYMSAVSIVTITVTLTVLCVFAMVTLLAHGFMEKVRKSEEINIYIEDSLSDEDMLALEAVISAMKEVDSTRIMSREDAAREFERLFGSDLLRAVDENPLPRSIIVTMGEGFRTSTDMERVAARIEDAGGVESVEYGREWMSRIDLFFLFFIFGELALVLLAVGSCVLVVSNTISMTILARSETIEIMRLVGASDGFIRKPFYVEGFIQGLSAGLVSFLLMYGIWKWLLHAVPDISAYVHMLAYPAILEGAGALGMAVIVPFGALTGLLGSVLAVRRAL